MDSTKQFASKSYLNVRSKGIPMAAVTMWTHRQSLTNHVTRANSVICILHDGIAITHDRHFVCVNSDVILYCTVSWKPIAMPMSNRSTANIIQETENAAMMLRTTKDNSARNRGGFRPTRSAIWPHARFPIKTPAICIDVMVVGIQSLWSHTRDHCNKTHACHWFVY